jgi:hypothetical protein
MFLLFRHRVCDSQGVSFTAATIGSNCSCSVQTSRLLLQVKTMFTMLTGTPHPFLSGRRVMVSNSHLSTSAYLEELSSCPTSPGKLRDISLIGRGEIEPHDSCLMHNSPESIQL